MTTLLLLEPEVAGGFGPKTEVDRTKIESGEAKVPEIGYLEYVFDGWLGDELLETFPCFIVTERLAADLKDAGLSGLRLGDVDVSKSGLFLDLHPDRELPPFRRLIPLGKVQLGEGGNVEEYSGHDLCMTERAELVVTERCLNVLRQHKIEHCEVTRLA
jgi:hypothetical protein